MRLQPIYSILLLTLLACTLSDAGFFGGAKSDQERAKQHAHDAAEDVRLSAKYARDAVGDAAEAVMDQGRAAVGGAQQTASHYYDKAGNVIENIRDYTGTVYDKAGNALGDAKDYAFDTARGARRTAEHYYDKAGNLIGNIRGYAGTVYDKSGNSLGDAKDFAYDTASEYYDRAGNLIENMQEYAGIVYDKAGYSIGDAKDFAQDTAQSYYDKAGNLIGSIRDYVGTVYDKAGNALGDAKDFVFGTAAGARHRVHEYYDSAGNAIGSLRNYVGTVYDRAGNALGDAKDFAFERASSAGSAGVDMVGEKLQRAGHRLKQTAGTYEEKSCGRMVADSIEQCTSFSGRTLWERIKSFFGSFTKLLLTLAAILIAAFAVTRLMGKRVNTDEAKRQARVLGGTIRAKAGDARQIVNGISHRAKETIGSKFSKANGRAGSNERESDSDGAQRVGETTHEYNLRTNRVPVHHYDPANPDVMATYEEETTLEKSARNESEVGRN